MAEKEAITENGIVIFKNSYEFEGKTYTQIDLSGIQNLTGREYCEIESQFEKSGNFSALKELNTYYAFLIAHKVTGMPIEFFNNLKGGDIMRIKNAVSSNFFN